MREIYMDHPHSGARVKSNKGRGGIRDGLSPDVLFHMHDTSLPECHAIRVGCIHTTVNARAHPFGQSNGTNVYVEQSTHRIQQPSPPQFSRSRARCRRRKQSDVILQDVSTPVRQRMSTHARGKIGLATHHKNSEDFGAYPRGDS